MKHKLIHFYYNKYLLSFRKREKYFISYDFEHKVLWYRVFKVGTRTIDHIFNESVNDNKNYIHSSEQSYSPSRYLEFFKFAFVRNPIDRLISAWKNKVIQGNYLQVDEQVYQKIQDLNHFLDWLEKQNFMHCDEHLRTQKSLIDLNHVNYIGRFENFDKDLQYISKLTGLKYDPNIHLNRSKSSVSIELTENQISRIAALYVDDIRMFYPELMNKLPN